MTKNTSHPLLKISAIHSTAETILNAARQNNLLHIRLHEDKMENLEQVLLQSIDDVGGVEALPFYSEWRSLEVGEMPRWDMLAEAANFQTAQEFARSAFDLIITNTLLRVEEASKAWSYEETASGVNLKGDDGLAVAGFNLFASGSLSNKPEDPLRADALALASLEESVLSANMQVSAGNPLPATKTQTTLLNRLGITISDQPDIFALYDDPRPGGLYDALIKISTEQDGYEEQKTLKAANIFEIVLKTLMPLWPDAIIDGETPLSETWETESYGRIPLHTTGLLITYSLIEPLIWTGIDVIGIEELPAPATKTNLKFLIQHNIIEPIGETPSPDSANEIERHALTIALLQSLRDKLNAKQNDLSLWHILGVIKAIS